MARLVICNAVLAAALVLASCGVGGSLGPASLEDQQARAQAATTTPHLQPGEKIRINVFGESSLSGDYEIDQSGFVSLPLAGTIKAAGFTQPQSSSRNWRRNSARSISATPKSRSPWCRCGHFSLSEKSRNLVNTPTRAGLMS